MIEDERESEKLSIHVLLTIYDSYLGRRSLRPQSHGACLFIAYSLALFQDMRQGLFGPQISPAVEMISCPTVSVIQPQASCKYERAVFH